MTAKTPAIFLISITGLIAAVLGMLTVGTIFIPLSTIGSAFFSSLFYTPSPETVNQTELIILHLRWQRIALALLVGSGLAVSGACFQTMFKNPLADPFVLGVSSGAALGAAISIITGHTTLLFPCAFLGAALSLALVYLLGQQSLHIRSDQQLLLAGVACGAMLNAFLSASMAIYSQQMQVILFWLMGSLSNYSDSLLPVLLIVVLGLSISLFFARDLDIMALGDNEARFLGVDVGKVKLLLLLSSTLMTGVCVAVSGVIGFIGLIVPHMVRKIAGPNHLLLLPLSAVWGALFLLAADSLTRLFPLMSSIPVGVVTALFGGPFFLLILYNYGRRLKQ